MTGTSGDAGDARADGRPIRQLLVLNCGSGTLKWSVLAADGRSVAQGGGAWKAEGEGARAEQIKEILLRAPPFDAVGHRVVHGGTRFVATKRVDKVLRDGLNELVELDPLHMRAAIAGIDAVTGHDPQMPQFAAFDTAFHSSLPLAASTYAVPEEWARRWGIRRFGFHGLSVAYSVRRAKELMAYLPKRIIVAHLGSGCSVTAVADGKSVDTTMGFTPLEGVVMGTRSGSVDPGILLHLETHCGLRASDIADALTRHSGLLGLSGVSGDFREVMAASESGSVQATLAVDVFILSVKRAIGQMMAVLGGADVLVFTGGIAENSPFVRREVTKAFAFAGFRMDPDVNERAKNDRALSTRESAGTVLVVVAREDLVILDDVLAAERPPNSA